MALFVTGTRAEPAPAAKDSLRVASIQYPVSGGLDLPAFLAKVEALAGDAREKGAELIVLPELAGLDLVDYRSGVSETEQLKRLSEDTSEAYFDGIAALSRKLGASVLGGTFPRRLSDGRIVNTAIFASPDGERILQDKLFLTPDEVRWGWSSGTDLRVFDTEWGRTVILTCYDSEFSSVSSLLDRFSPELILVPSMTESQGLHRVRWASQARAVEHHAYVVVAGVVEADVSQLRPGTFQGQAAILTPRQAGFPGVLAEGELDRPGAVIGQLDLAALRVSRGSAGIYPARDAASRTEPIRVIAPPVYLK